jgi:hypothetical protein
VRGGHAGHLTIYLSDDVERRVRKAAKAAKVSVRQWVADHVVRCVETSLPPEFLVLAEASNDRLTWEPGMSTQTAKALHGMLASSHRAIHAVMAL